ncbi:MAG TPA: DUF1361 domain-containing protein [Patescibacteria group bacterium]|nr:DUF1361 domain-containing protein [Patescibacteria group bacterium]
MKQVEGGGRLVWALCVSSLVSVLLYVISSHYYGAEPFWFLNWNLVLAWLPLIFAIMLVRHLKDNPWISGMGALLTLLWLTFLPNSFYLITDLIHLGFADSTQKLYYVIMFFSFSFNGLILGYISLYLLHQELLKRLKPRTAHVCIGVTLLLCSFAIYLGRYLRWSTWDIILHPIGVVFDVSDRIINPVAYGQTFQVTALFFILLGSMYFTLWHLVAAVRGYKPR